MESEEESDDDSEYSEASEESVTEGMCENLKWERGTLTQRRGLVNKTSGLFIYPKTWEIVIRTNRNLSKIVIF